jgi:hypothetical protein
MWLNIFGNRSYNDISQYPVFPWILSNYEDPLNKQFFLEKAHTDMVMIMSKQEVVKRNSSIMGNIKEEEDEADNDYQYRDMNLPMGMLELNEEGKKRKELFLETYETLKEEPDENMKPYVFGSNYSNPIYVCNYLMRLFPFAHISIELQGKKFDDPNRLFLSVKQSFYNSISQKTDVRELIPEFFYLPEMFRNINNLNMGKLENGQEVDNVETPCNDDPYDFVTAMKSALESNKISYTIQNWIDLIFGYKAKGKDAESANNLFTEASYQENIEIAKVANKESYLRMVEFGLIPTQIISKECSKREKRQNIKKGKEITNSKCDLKCYVSKLSGEKEGIRYSSKLTVLKMVSFSQEKIILLLNNNKVVEKKIIFSPFDKKYFHEFYVYNLNQAHKLYNKMPEFYFPKLSNGKVFEFIQNGKILIIGGFYDGSVIIFPLDQKTPHSEINPFTDNSPIVSISVGQDEEFLFFGNAIGNVAVFKTDKNPNDFKLYKIITDHMSAISHINCNSELNLWTSGSIDGYINIYTLPLSKLVRSIKLPASNLDFVFLSASPMPSIISIAKDNNKSEISLYSINGKLLNKETEQAVLSNPMIITDLNSINYLSYVLNHSIVIRRLSSNLMRRVLIDQVPSLYAFCPSEDMKMLYAIDRTGNDIFVIKEESKSAK